MKKSLSCLLMICTFAISAQAKNEKPLICSNEKNGTSTLLLIDNGLLALVCQRSPQDEKKENQEICANDQFTMTSRGTVNGKSNLVFESLETGVIFTLSLGENKNDLILNSEYSVQVMKGDKKVQISTEAMELTCDN